MKTKAIFGAQVLLLHAVLLPVTSRAALQEAPCDFSDYKPVRIDHFLPHSIVRSAKPAYPQSARDAKVEGDVTVRILVDRKGRVRAACIVDGHALLQAAALDAAKKYRFRKDFGFGRGGTTAFLQDLLVFRFRLAGATTPSARSDAASSTAAELSHAPEPAQRSSVVPGTAVAPAR
jgi:TonB family protein